MPAADDQVLGAPGQGDEAVGVDRPEVAGVEPPVAQLASPGHRCGPGAAAAQVAGEDVRPTQDERADLIVGQERPVAGCLVNLYGAHLLVGQALSDAPAAWSIAPAERARAGPFGEPVALAQRDTGAVLKGTGNGRRKRRGTDDRKLEARDVGIDRHPGEGRVHGRNARHGRDAVVLDDLPEVRIQRRIAVAERSAPHDMLSLEQRCQHGHEQRVRVKQRQPREQHAVGVERLARGDHPRIGDLVRVRARRQLRDPRRAAGVEVAGDLVRIRTRDRLSGRSRRSPSALRGRRPRSRSPQRLEWRAAPRRRRSGGARAARAHRSRRRSHERSPTPPDRAPDPRRRSPGSRTSGRARSRARRSDPG